MRKLRIGVIGLGYLGKFHAEKLAQIKEAELTAVVDLTLEKAKKVVQGLKKHTEKLPEIFQDYRKIVDKVDAVSIVTPTTTHYEIARFFLEKGKPVFLEKPVSHDLKLAEKLLGISREKNIPVQVGYIERFQECVEKLFEKVKKPVFIEAHRISSFVERNLDIDVVLDLMIHDLDLALKIKNFMPVKTVHAVGAPVFTELPDIVSARVIFEDGTTCNFTASRVSLGRQRRFRVFEKGAYYCVDTIEKSFLEIRVVKEKKGYVSQKEEFKNNDPLKMELEAFVKSILEGKRVEVPIEEAIHSLRVAFKIKASVEENLKKCLENFK
jgi:predicted dehydrogenase